MKRYVAVISLVFTLASLVFALAACGPPPALPNLPPPEYEAPRPFVIPGASPSQAPAPPAALPQAPAPPAAPPPAASKS